MTNPIKSVMKRGTDEEHTPLLRSRRNTLQEYEGIRGHHVPPGLYHGPLRLSFNSEAANSLVEPEGPDGGWGWLVVLSSFFCLFVLGGTAYTFGVFLDPLLVEMKESHSVVSIAGSLLVATYSFMGPVAARLVSKFGTRVVCMTGAFISAVGLGLGSLSAIFGQILATYSIITGVGFGLMYIPAIVVVANHFTKQRSLALSMCISGMGVGTFVLSTLETDITNNYGWRMGFISLASLSLLCVICGLTMTSVVKEEWMPTEADDLSQAETPHVKKKWLDHSFGLIVDHDLYHNPAFSLYLLTVIGDLAAIFCLYIPYQHLPSLIQERGLSSYEASYIISATGICSVPGRLLAGWFVDRSIGHPLSIITICISLVLPPLFLMTVCETFWPFLICTSLYGFLTGGWLSLMSPLFVRILGLTLLTPAFGLLTAVEGFGALIGPPFAAFAVEYFTDRRAALLVGGVSMTISALIFLSANIYCNRRDNKAVLITRDNLQIA